MYLYVLVLYVCVCGYEFIYICTILHLWEWHTIDICLDRDVDTNIDVRDLCEEVTQHSDK